MNFGRQILGVRRESAFSLLAAILFIACGKSHARNSSKHRFSSKVSAKAYSYLVPELGTKSLHIFYTGQPLESIAAWKLYS
jgi:hypothetical protein